MSRLRTAAVIAGVFCACAFIALFGAVFMAAYANGGSVTVAINEFGEANVEALLIPVASALALFALVEALRTVPKDGGQR
ncbi:hypothetical protein [Halorarius litoreus]|uniref:hypothetical protein n=1 Tax=Halorarius litoreus TaxID=2962676 RepID=UPI0020CEECD5|nr:hypothetical protein [Halorarius litoreus]